MLPENGTLTIERPIVVSEDPTDVITEGPSLPVGYVPTPTGVYRTHRKAQRATAAPGLPPAPLPIPIPIPIPLPLLGSRTLIWKQDPSVAEIGIRKVFVPGVVLAGPRDARVKTAGTPVVSPNAMGDYIVAPGTPEFDAVHAYTVVRQTLTMYQRALSPNALPWQWNGPANTDPLTVFARHSNMMNAFYSRSQKLLAFGFFTEPGPPPNPLIFTCRSLDIVAHETGHAVLDGLKPGWLGFGNPPQTGGLHESFGDLTAIFVALSQMDQVEAIIAQTKANLHNKTFLADLAEQFGSALGKPNGLRNADNDFKLSQVGNEVHAISQVFTGAIYDIMADIFAFERKPAKREDAAVLYEVGQYLLSLVLRAIVAAPNAAATYTDVANQMLQISAADGKPVQYRNFIRNRFQVREVVVAPVPLTADVPENLMLEPGFTNPEGTPQDRSSCCGTMQLAELTGGEEAIGEELDELRRILSENDRAVVGQRAKAAA